MKNKGRAELEAEVARLRQQLQLRDQEALELMRDVDAERAAHEATKTDLATAQQRKRLIAEQRDAAEARVAELETSLNEARGLLERCQYAVPSVLTELLDAVSGWLRAHPAPKGNG